MHPQRTLIEAAENVFLNEREIPDYALDIVRGLRKPRRPINTEETPDSSADKPKKVNDDRMRDKFLIDPQEIKTSQDEVERKYNDPFERRRESIRTRIKHQNRGAMGY